MCPRWPAAQWGAPLVPVTRSSSSVPSGPSTGQPCMGDYNWGWPLGPRPLQSPSTPIFKQKQQVPKFQHRNSGMEQGGAQSTGLGMLGGLQTSGEPRPNNGGPNTTPERLNATAASGLL